MKKNWLYSVFVPTEEKVELELKESWSVMWTSRHGRFYDDIKEQCRFFTSESDAKAFKTALQDAFKLILHTSGTTVTIQKDV